MTETPLDRAWAEAEGEAGAARFWEVFAAAELFLAIDPDTLDTDAPRPLSFAVEGAETALAFDTEERLIDFLGDGAAHLSLSGRALAGMLAEAGAQLGLNLGEAPSAQLLPPDALAWAAAAFGQPIEAERRAALALGPPEGATPELLARIDARLAALGPVVAEAWLCGAAEEGLILLLRLAEPDAEPAAIAALAETARFAGGDRPAFALAAVSEGEPALEAARRSGLGFEPPKPAIEPASPPGFDPARPPKLK